MATPGTEFVILRRRVPGPSSVSSDPESELRELEKEINNNRDATVAALLQQAIQRVCTITFADGAAIATSDQRGVICRASVGEAPEVGSRLTPDSVLTRQCFDTGQVVICEDIHSDYRVRDSVAQNLRLRSAALAPLKDQGQVLGVIEVFSSRPSAFTAVHVAGLQRVGEALARVLTPTPLPVAVEQAAVDEPDVEEPELEAPAVEEAAVESFDFENVEKEISMGSGATQEIFPQKSEDITRVPALVPTSERLREKVRIETPLSPQQSKNNALLAACLGILLLLLLVWFALRHQPVAPPAIPNRAPASAAQHPVNAGAQPQSAPAQSSQPGSSKPESSQTQSLTPGNSSHPEASAALSPSGTESNSTPQEKTPALQANGVESQPGPVVRPASPPALTIQGAPPQTQVFLDNRLVASANPGGKAEIATLAAGQHHLRLRVNGYRDYDQEVDIQGGKAATITAKLDPLELPALSEPARSSAPWIASAIAPPAIPAPAILSRPALPDFTLDRTFKAHNGWVTGVAFSPDGQRLVSGSWDRTVKFWEVGSGERLSTVASKMKEVQSLAFSRDGQWLATENSSDTTSLRDPSTGQEIRAFPSEKSLGAVGSNWVYSIAFSPDGRLLATAVDEKTIRLWDVNSGQKVRDLTGRRRPVMYIAFSPDGRLLATGDDEKNIRIWDTASGEERYRLSGHKKQVYAVAFSPDGRWLASASGDKTIKIWDMSTGRELHTLAGHENVVTSLAFSPHGRWLVSGSWDKTVRIWEVGTGRVLQTLSGYDHAVYSVALDPRGRWLASGSEDGTIKLWRLGDTAK